MKTITNTDPVIKKAEKSLLWRILPDIFAFGMGLSIAYFLDWETSDLVWSLWLCSLMTGYLTLLAALAGGGWVGINLMQHADFDKKKYFFPALLGGIAIGVFFLGFFSIHFGGFHSIHAVFLGGFFPLEGVPTDDFGDGFMNPPKLIYLAFAYLIKPYGLFIIPALITERKHVFKALFDTIDEVREGKQKTGKISKKSKSGGIGDAMGRPYVNVVRMHLLIFFFALAHALKFDSFLVYAVVYFVYFFPWREVKKLRGSFSAR